MGEDDINTRNASRRDEKRTSKHNIETVWKKERISGQI
jgi:hypothetical protein